MKPTTRRGASPPPDLVGPSLDAIVVSEIFENVPPVSDFHPATDPDHAARVLSRMRDLGFRCDMRGLVCRGRILPAPTRFNFTLTFRGLEALFGAGCNDLSQFPWTVCCCALTAIRTVRKEGLRLRQRRAS